MCVCVVYVCECISMFWGGCVALQSCVRDVDSRNSRKIFENRTSVDDRDDDYTARRSGQTLRGTRGLSHFNIKKKKRTKQYKNQIDNLHNRALNIL